MTAATAATRPCKVCEAELPNTRQYFYTAASGRCLDGTCKACRCKQKARQYAADPERYRARSRKQAKALRAVAQEAATGTTLPERLQAALDRFLERSRLATRGYHYRQRARRYGVAAQPVDLRALWQRSGGRCHLCGEAITGGEPWTADHIIPLILGGPHTEANLAVAHHRCNARKRAKLAITAELIQQYSAICAQAVVQSGTASI